MFLAVVWTYKRAFVVAVGVAQQLQCGGETHQTVPSDTDDPVISYTITYKHSWTTESSVLT